MNSGPDRKKPLASGQWHEHCVMCGEQNPLSMKLRFREEGEDVEAEFLAHPRLQGYGGILHGGVTCALLDAAMTHCLFRHGVEGVTADLRTRFLQPVPCDARLRIRGRLVKSRPPLFYLEGEIFCDRTLLARAEAKFMRRG